METEAVVRFALEELPMPLTLRPATPMSEEHLLRFCSANKGYQIETEPDGSISINEPKGARYSRLLARLNTPFDLWTETDGRGIAFINIGVIFPDGSMRSPSLAWISNQRWQALSEAQKDRFLHLIPEFIAEIRCRTDTDENLAIRMRRWMEAGAQLAWLIDPQRKLAMIYRPGQDPETLLQPETLNGEGPIAGFTLKMQRLWE